MDDDSGTCPFRRFRGYKEDDSFWADVEAAYIDSINDGIQCRGDELWEFAKKRARYRYFVHAARERGAREGRDFADVMCEMREAERQKKLN
jgi:hypothetical protein